MKVCILAIDSLDHKLVEKYQLLSLKQEVHGSFTSIINKSVGQPVSPQVWGSFLTGQKQEIDSWIQATVGRRWLHSIIPKTFAQMALKQLGDSAIVKPKNLKGTTINCTIPRTIAIEFPFINYDVTRSMLNYMKALSSKGPSEWRKKEEKRQLNRLCKIEENIPGDWDLLLAYIPILDGYGHLFYNNPSVLKVRHRLLETRIKKILDKLRENNIYTIIISDHGYDGMGGHSDTCFYSLSEDKGFRPKSIMDFYDHIVGVVNED